MIDTVTDLKTIDPFGVLHREPLGLRLRREANARLCTVQAALADLRETVEALGGLVDDGEAEDEGEAAA